MPEHPQIREHLYLFTREHPWLDDIAKNPYSISILFLILGIGLVGDDFFLLT